MFIEMLVWGLMLLGGKLLNIIVLFYKDNCTKTLRFSNVNIEN